MGNGIPIGGLLISPIFEAKKGMLGTTFGGNHLACAAAIAVLDVMKEESLVDNAANIGKYLIEQLVQFPAVREIRGRGLMLGIEFIPEQASARNRLLFESHIFTGEAKNNVMRLLPPLSISKSDVDHFINELQRITN
jgi:acetylornithine aminotransferase